jgi:hypothetical protein
VIKRAISFMVQFCHKSRFVMKGYQIKQATIPKKGGPF